MVLQLSKYFHNVQKQYKITGKNIVFGLVDTQKSREVYLRDSYDYKKRCIIHMYENTYDIGTI